MRRAMIPLFLILLFLPAFAGAEEQRYTVPILDSPSKGPENAPVTIVEFLDFQ